MRERIPEREGGGRGLGGIGNRRWNSVRFWASLIRYAAVENRAAIDVAASASSGSVAIANRPLSFEWSREKGIWARNG